MVSEAKDPDDLDENHVTEEDRVTRLGSCSVALLGNGSLIRIVLHDGPDEDVRIEGDQGSASPANLLATCSRMAISMSSMVTGRSGARGRRRPGRRPRGARGAGRRA